MVGYEGSYTTVKELRVLPPSPRKGEVIRGDPPQVAKRLAEIIKQLP